MTTSVAETRKNSVDKILSELKEDKIKTLNNIINMFKDMDLKHCVEEEILSKQDVSDILRIKELKAKCVIEKNKNKAI